MASCEVNLDYEPTEKQQLLHNCPARQILFGGAAGGGKSHSLRLDGVISCLSYPGMQAFLFRRTYKQLLTNHVEQLKAQVPKSVGQFIGENFVFKNGSILYLCHCQNLNDYLNYQGAEFHWLGIDEASLFEPRQIVELRARVRLGKFQSVTKGDRYFPRMVLTSNPGGPGHNFLKEHFISPAEPMTIFYDSSMASEQFPQGWTTCFIPSRMADNPHLDAEYGAVFSGMNPERAKALRDGDWDAVEGAALFNLSYRKHAVKPFEPPEHWIRFQSMDWGTARPFSVGWYAVASENTIVRLNGHVMSEENPSGEVFIPAGAVVRFKEWYGCVDKQPDTGLYLDSTQVGREIVAREKEMKRKPDYRVCDNAIFACVDGPSIAEKMRDATDGKLQFRFVKKDAVNQYNEVISRLAGNPYLMQDGKSDRHPALFITTNCLHAWRTLPTLVVDPEHPDDGPEGGENHVYDELAYALASRPYVRTKKEYSDELATLKYVKDCDPYAMAEKRRRRNG